MFADFTDKIKTTEDKQLLMDEINLVLKSLYQNTDMYNNVLQSTIRAWVRAAITQNLEVTPDKEKYFKSLLTELAKLEEFDIVIPMDLSQSGLERIFYWVKDNIGAGIVLDIKIDSKLIGGAIFMYRGKYIDLSMKKKFEELFGSVYSNLQPKTAQSVPASNI